MKSFTIRFVLCHFLVALFPLGLLAEKGVEAATDTIAFQPKGGYYAFSHSKKWRRIDGQGYTELRGIEGDRKNVIIRVYAASTRAIGGRYRNLEHVVDDMIFQVRDEFKGKVMPKESVKIGADDALRARRLQGTQPVKDTQYQVDFYAAEHPLHKGVVLSFSVFAPEDVFETYHAEALEILGTLKAQRVP